MSDISVSKHKVINKAMLSYTFAFFLSRTVLKSSQTSNGGILLRKAFLEKASCSVILLVDEAVVKILEKLFSLKNQS